MTEPPLETIVLVRRARLEDLDAIMVIEETRFTAPWPASVLAHDLQGATEAAYWVAVIGGAITAYLGGWLYDVEFHVGSVATARAWCRRGLGELLMLTALEHARERGADLVVLEYRVSNRAAEALYAKLGFEVLRTRRRYYADREDAREAALLELQTEACGEELRRQAQRWAREHPDLVLAAEPDAARPPGDCCHRPA